MKLLMIADDLTGALDTAVQVSGCDVKTLAAAWADAEIGDCEALSVNLDMRHDTPDEAFRKVSDLLERFPGVPYIYLKTDSVLRGNLSAAFAALLQSRGGPVVFVPAYPKAGRITIDGEQYVGGVRLGDSSFAHDPLNPMTTGVIRDILNASHKVDCVCVPEGGHIPQPKNIEDHVLVFDCGTQEALARIGGLLHKRGALSLSAGCAGFAEILCGHIPFLREPAEFTPDSGPVLFLSGSANHATFDQLAHGRKNGIEIVKIPVKLKLQSASPLQDDLSEIFQKLDARLSAGKSAVLATAESPGDLVELGNHGDIQRIFAMVARYFADKGCRNFAIFGGDTAIAVLRELNLGCVRPLHEIQSGIPLCVAGEMHIATKSGGLGDVDAVTAIDVYLRKKLQ